MKKSFFSIIVIFVCFSSLLAYSGGSGASNDPYQISNFDDLVQLSTTAADWRSYFIQTADINAAASRTINISGSDTLGFLPIGSSYNSCFKGHYDGNGYMIDSLYINRPARGYVALFGYCSSADIKNIIITRADITGENIVGALIGNCFYTSTINCSTSGVVTGQEMVGGLFGHSDRSQIYNSYSNADVVGTKDCGGFAGHSYYNSIIENCYSSGSVKGTDFVGGFLGRTKNMTIENCYSSGFVEGDGENIGGLIGGSISSIITNSFWDSDASGQKSSSGGTAKSTSELKTAETFTNLSTVGLDSSWDFSGYLCDDSDTTDIWVLSNQNNGYPTLKWAADSDSLYALISSDSLRDITETSVVAHGNIAYLGSSNPQTHGFCWSSDGIPYVSDQTTDEGSAASIGAFSSQINGLISGTSYYIRAYVTNSAGTSYGRTMVFSAGKAIVTTDSITAFAGTSVTANGNILDLGATTATMYGFCWNLSGSPDTSNSKTDEGATNTKGAFSSQIDDLLDGHQYYIRAYSVNNTGISYGSEIIFIAHQKPEGSGTESNPYQINSLGTLYWITQNSDAWGAEFIQTADINAAPTKNWDGKKGLTVIGKYKSEFKGKYHGRHHTIDSLFINRPNTQQVGLFGYTSGAVFDSLGMVNVNIVGNTCVGALAGLSYNSSTVTACYSSGNITSEGNNYCGGLLGRNYYSTLKNCYSTCNVKAGGNVGGLSGDTYHGEINSCYSVSTVEGTNYAIGGLVGNISEGYISNCYSVSKVKGVYSVGGLVGGSYNGTLRNCYSRSMVSFQETGGGLIGDNAKVTIKNCFWDSTLISQKDTLIAGTPKTSDELKNYFTFTDTSFSAGLDTAWDFIGNINDDSGNEDIWDMDQSGSGYPIFSWQKNADNIVNTAPVIDIPDSLTFTNDSSFVLNIWDYAEDADMPDSLLNFYFTLSSDSVLFEYDAISGLLTLSAVDSFIGKAQLIVEVRDYAVTAKDSTTINITKIISGLAEENIPLIFSLSQNYPNPFNPTTTIEFSLPVASDVHLVIYNVAGQCVKAVNMNKQPGNYKFVWNGTNEAGNMVSSGIYFYKIDAGKQCAIKKMVFLK